MSKEQLAREAEVQYGEQVLASLNQARQAAGTHVLTINPTLADAAKKHSKYLLAHAEISHYQTKRTSQFFTGQVASVRSKRERYDYSALSEVIRGSFAESPSDMMRNFIAAPFHRIGLFRDDLLDAGVGLEQVLDRNYRLLTIDMGSREVFYYGQRQTVPITWPYAGQSDVPLSFSSDDEIPDPYPGKNLIGYPITLQVSTQDLLSVKDFQLIKVSSGEKVPSLYVWRENMGYLKSLPFAAILMPTDPLEPGTTYQAVFEGSTSESGMKLSWRFTTLPR